MDATTKKYSIKTDFTMLSILLVPIAVALNFIGSQIAHALKLPLYLDTIGTVLVALLCGPWVGAVGGLLTNLMTGITNPVSIAFAPVNIAVGLVTGFLARKNMFSVWWKWVISMLLMALASLIVATPIVVIVFGGVTGSGSSLIAATMMASGTKVLNAVLSTELVFTCTDRAIAFFITWLVVRVIPARTLVKYPCGENYIKSESAEA